MAALVSACSLTPEVDERATDDAGQASDASSIDAGSGSLGDAGPRARDDDDGGSLGDAGPRARDDDDGNTGLASATPSTGAPMPGSTTGSDDRDYIGFDAVAGSFWIIAIDSPDLSARAQLTISLLDSSGRVVFSDPPSGRVQCVGSGPVHLEIIHRVTRAGRYYVEVGASAIARREGSWRFAEPIGWSVSARDATLVDEVLVVAPGEGTREAPARAASERCILGALDPGEASEWLRFEASPRTAVQPLFPAHVGSTLTPELTVRNADDSIAARASPTDLLSTALWVTPTRDIRLDRLGAPASNDFYVLSVGAGPASSQEETSDYGDDFASATPITTPGCEPPASHWLDLPGGDTDVLRLDAVTGELRAICSAARIGSGVVDLAAEIIDASGTVLAGTVEAPFIDNTVSATSSAPRTLYLSVRGLGPPVPSRVTEVYCAVTVCASSRS
jgi:hypothetical protein